MSNTYPTKNKPTKKTKKNKKPKNQTNKQTTTGVTPGAREEYLSSSCFL